MRREPSRRLLGSNQPPRFVHRGMCSKRQRILQFLRILRCRPEHWRMQWDTKKNNQLRESISRFQLDLHSSPQNVGTSGWRRNTSADQQGLAFQGLSGKGCRLYRTDQPDNPKWLGCEKKTYSFKHKGVVLQKQERKIRTKTEKKGKNRRKGRQMKNKKIEQDKMKK